MLCNYGLQLDWYAPPGGARVERVCGERRTRGHRAGDLPGRHRRTLPSRTGLAGDRLFAHTPLANPPALPRRVPAGRRVPWRHPRLRASRPRARKPARAVAYAGAVSWLYWFSNQYRMWQLTRAINYIFNFFSLFLFLLFIVFFIHQHNLALFCFLRKRGWIDLIEEKVNFTKSGLLAFGSRSANVKVLWKRLL